MRTLDVDILIVPGWTGSGPDHWQTRWEGRLQTARRVALPDPDRPVKDAWVSAIVAAVAACERPVVLVAHSCGVAAVAHAAPLLARGRTVAAMLVAPADLGRTEALEHWRRTEAPDARLPVGFDPLPEAPLPFPTLLIASRNDVLCTYEAAGEMALSWGSTLVDAGEVGHLNTASGHGPWPEGAMRFGLFLKQLGDAASPTS